MAKERGKISNEFKIPGLGSLEDVANRPYRLNLLRLFISNNGLII